ncbi:hypothetical protein CN501_15630 [Bacillus cereus]|uniref:hypothetical protein n=1 Tax=Bacillus cereus TaxID=1396 RepID=UPI000BED415C|nr:hypothetical protein [Bacillus cereus]PED02207.1 hypothetical protein CON14_14390 [Bacillus cereus]PES13091.1 hypothetical protein CN501_15630 [Bacillus cereus]
MADHPCLPGETLEINHYNFSPVSIQLNDCNDTSCIVTVSLCCIELAAIQVFFDPDVYNNIFIHNEFGHINGQLNYRGGNICLACNAYLNVLGEMKQIFGGEICMAPS